MAAYVDIARGVETAKNEVITPKRTRSFKLGQGRLTTVVENVLQQYGPNPSLLSSDNERRASLEEGFSRCRHA